MSTSLRTTRAGREAVPRLPAPAGEADENNLKDGISLFLNLEVERREVHARGRRKAKY